MRLGGSVMKPYSSPKEWLAHVKELGYSEGYKYAHDYEGNFVEQEFLPESLSGKCFYHPNKQNASEAKIAERMEQLWGNKYQ